MDTPRKLSTRPTWRQVNLDRLRFRVEKAPGGLWIAYRVSDLAFADLFDTWQDAYDYALGRVIDRMQEATC